LGRGLFVASIGLGAGKYLPSYGKGIGVLVVGAGTVYTIYKVNSTMNELNKTMIILKSEYIACLIGCRLKYPGNDDTALDAWETYGKPAFGNK
jgi:hypothetical protein